MTLWNERVNSEPRPDLISMLAHGEATRAMSPREYLGNVLSFGFGIHRCVGKHLAEMQLKILWEEILQRGWTIAVASEPKRVFSSFIHGFTELPVSIAVAG
ncbi:MAG: cytochrome P450 [Xanthobacteraceae bacterium]